MPKTRDNYLISGNTVEEVKRDLNFKLQRFADRMDKIEGIRGTSEVQSDLDLNQNNIIDLASSVDTTDGTNQSELPDQGTSTTDSPTFASVTLTANLTVAGTTTMTGNVTASANMTVEGDTQVVGIDSTGGFTFTDSSSTVLHQMGGV